MKITGQILRENRERRSISINEVAIATKINAKTIAAMEAGDTANLPPKTFLRGFVRAYASYLDLDVDSLLSTFFEEMGSTKPTPPEVVSASARGNSEEADRAINPKTSPIVTIGAIAGILLLVVLIVFFKNKMEGYEKEAVPATPPSGLESLRTGTPDALANAVAGLSPAPTAAAADMVSPTASASPTPTAAPTATATPSPTPSPKPTATPTPTPTPKPTETPSPTPKPSAVPVFAMPTASASPSGTPSASPSGSPTPSPSPKPSKTNEILIEAFRGVTIDATIDGESKKISLQNEQVHTIRAKKVSLQISDGGAVNITVNGNDRGVPGDLGKPKHVELP